MAMCAFFPWLSVGKRIEIGNFILFPYAPGTRVTENLEVQRQIDTVLRPYESGGRPIASATLIRSSGAEWNSDLSDEIRSDLFVLAELLATAGLSEREFFTIGSIGYQNR